MIARRASVSAQFLKLCPQCDEIDGNGAGSRRRASCASWLRLDLDDHHEEAMRAESRCSTATAETASGARWTTARACWVGALTGIAAHADASEVGVGHIVVTSGRRWFLCCNLAGGRLGEPAKGYGEQGLPDILWRTCPQRSCPRNNTWHRPKLSTAVRDRSVRTQCTSLSHGGARAPEKKRIPLSEDKTASTVR